MNRTCKIILAALVAAGNFAAVAQTTNIVAPSSFPKFISDRNIFDPNRVPNVPYVARPRQIYTAPVVKQVEAFSLVGIIGYGEGRMAGVYAFFDGTSADYRKTAQLNDTIANFKITDISADSVTLTSDTNSQTILKVGEQLHNDGVGHWLSEGGIAARYSGGNFGNGRNGNRNGFGNGNGRRRNFGNGNNGSYNGGNFNNGNYRGRNNYGTAAGTFDNSQAGDQTQGDQNMQNDNSAPDNSPDNTAPADDNSAQDARVPSEFIIPTAQDNSTVQQPSQQPASSTDSTDPNSIRARLQAERAAQLQQIGH